MHTAVLACGEWMWEEELNSENKRSFIFYSENTCVWLCEEMIFWLKLIVKLKRKMNNLMVASIVTEKNPANIYSFLINIFLITLKRFLLKYFFLFITSRR